MNEFIDDLQDQIKNYDARLKRENKIFTEFQLMLLKKYRGNHADEKTPCFLIPSLDGHGGARFPMEIYEKEKKEFFKDYQHLMP